MKDEKKLFANIDEYIAEFPPATRKILEEIRRVIKKSSPDAVEKISYNIPAFFLKDKQLIYFAAHKTHVGLYPVRLDNEELNAEISEYADGKATLKFPYAKPIPYDLISKIVKAKAKENVAETEKKSTTANPEPK